MADEHGAQYNATNTPLPTRSANYVTELAIGSNSPTQIESRRSLSTTMTKTKKRSKTYGHETIAEPLGANEYLLCGSGVRKPASGYNTDTRDNVVENGDISFLSRDGDLTMYTNISMSTPEFIENEEMPPPRGAKHPQSSHIPAATQAMSEWSENPLEILMQPQVSDDLPSTKPSFEEEIKDSAGHCDEIQDEMGAALLIDDGLLAGSNVNKYDTKGAIEQDFVAVESMDELADPDTLVIKSRSSRKRTRDELDPNRLESHKATKVKLRGTLEEDNIFDGLPMERYQPRKSRSRAAEMDNDMFENIDFSKRPEAKKRGKKNNAGRRHTTGGAVVVQVDDEDVFEAVEERTFTPAKSRSRKGKFIQEENLEDSVPSLKRGGSQTLLLSGGHDNKIPVASMTRRFQDLDDGENEEEVKNVYKKKRTKKDRQIITKSNSLQETKNATISTAEGNDRKAKEEFNVDAVESLSNPASTLEERTDRPKKSKRSKATRTKTKNSSGFDGISESGEALEDKRASLSKSDKVEVIDLPSSSIPYASRDGGSLVKEPASPLHDKAYSVDRVEVNEKQEDGGNGEGEMKSQPLSDTTNVALTPKQIPPDKSRKEAIKQDTFKGRKTYRIGLSRLSRIEPLLKIVCKDKAVPEAAKASKKGKQD